MICVRRVGFVAVVLGAIAGLSGCSTVLLNRPSARQADGWTITLGEVRDGPNVYPTGGTNYGPGDAEKFIWTVVTIRNDVAAVRSFSYDACALDGKGQSYVPVLVDRHTIINSLTEKSESFDPGQVRTRRLIFSYPEALLPAEMRCGPMAWPIPHS